MLLNVAFRGGRAVPCHVPANEIEILPLATRGPILLKRLPLSGDFMQNNRHAFGCGLYGQGGTIVEPKYENDRI